MPPAPDRKTNRFDAEIAATEAKWQFLNHIADGVRFALILAGCAVPLWALSYVVSPLAGKTTNANIHLNIALAGTLGLSGTINLLQFVKGRERRNALQQQRQTIEVLETKAGLPIRDERQQIAKADG